MKYFIDTEFIESFHKPLFGKRRHFIDLISIAIVAEDGREYQAISNEYKYKDASDWVKKNVIDALYAQTVPSGAKYELYAYLKPDNFHKEFGKSNREIAKDIFLFVNPNINPWDYQEFCKKNNSSPDLNSSIGSLQVATPEFYGYYCDYDWVLLCSLFGTMMDLPKGFPMYCRDLKQMLDGKVQYNMKLAGISKSKYQESFELFLDMIKSDFYYPKYPLNHLSIEDARRNKNMYEFLMGS